MLSPGPDDELTRTPSRSNSKVANKCTISPYFSPRPSTSPLTGKEHHDARSLSKTKRKRKPKLRSLSFDDSKESEKLVEGRSRNFCKSEYELPNLVGSAVSQGKMKEQERKWTEYIQDNEFAYSDNPDSDSESCSSPSLSVLYEKLGLLKPLLIQERLAHDPWKLLVAVTLLNKTTAKVALPVFWEIVSRWGTPWDLVRADVSELKFLLHPLGTYTIRSQRLVDLSNAYLRDPPSKYDARPSRSRIKLVPPSTPSKKLNSNSPHPLRTFSPLSLLPESTPGTPSSSRPSSSTSPSPPSNPPTHSFRRTRATAQYPPTPISHLPGTGPYALDSYRIFCTVHEDPFSEEWKDVRPSDKELIRYLKWKWTYEEHKEWSPILGVVQPASRVYLRTLIEELEGDRDRNSRGVTVGADVLKSRKRRRLLVDEEG